MQKMQKKNKNIGPHDHDHIIHHTNTNRIKHWSFWQFLFGCFSNMSCWIGGHKFNVAAGVCRCCWFDDPLSDLVQVHRLHLHQDQGSPIFTHANHAIPMQYPCNTINTQVKSLLSLLKHAGTVHDSTNQYCCCMNSVVVCVCCKKYVELCGAPRGSSRGTSMAICRPVPKLHLKSSKLKLSK